MKHSYLLITLLLITSVCIGQTNVFPTNGNVGIGLTNPDLSLHVQINSEGKPNGIVSPTIAGIKLSRSGTHNYSYPEAAEFRIGHGGPNVWGSKLDLFVNGESNQTNIPDQQVMTWMYNGNVGIGTTDPSNLLTLQTSANQGLLLKDPNNNNRGAFLYDGVQSLLIQALSGPGGADQATMKFQTADINGATHTRMLIMRDGNVGIGTTAATDKLSVNGNIRAKEVKVETANWPDYVFTKSYQLPTLQETEEHIKEKGHLPGIPSANEVKANGIDLGEMNAKLLQKIEELTLHLIELKKEVEQLKLKPKNQSR